VNAETSKEEEATQYDDLVHNKLKERCHLQERNPCDVFDERRENIALAKSVLE
jgi:hypothetical protein